MSLTKSETNALINEPPRAIPIQRTLRHAGLVQLFDAFAYAYLRALPARSTSVATVLSVLHSYFFAGN